MKSNTHSQTFQEHALAKVPIVGILRNVSPHDVLQILPIYIDAGLTTIEISMNSADAERTIEQAVRTFGAALNLGAGTVCSVDDLERAINAGAQFVVAPNTDEEVIRTCAGRTIPIFPGALTPTEVLKAWKLGATMVKLFPARVMGEQYIRDILEPLNGIKVMATGGIGLANISGYFAAGVTALGLGSSLFPKGLIEKKQWQGLHVHFKKFVTEVKTCGTPEED